MARVRETHGYTKSDESRQVYGVWGQMLQRCRNPNVKSYPQYGGRGIKVCERWNSFANFIADVGPRPGPGYQLDRIDNDGDYEPGNCEWNIRKINCRNKTNNVRLSLNGVTKTLTEWSEQLGIDIATLSCRRSRGLTDEQVLTTPLGFRSDAVKFTANGFTRTASEWAELLSVSATRLRQRSDMGWSDDKVINTPFRTNRKPIFLTLNGKTQHLNEWSKELGISKSTLRERKLRGLSDEEILTTPIQWSTRKCSRTVQSPLPSQ